VLLQRSIKCAIVNQMVRFASSPVAASNHRQVFGLFQAWFASYARKCLFFSDMQPARRAVTVA
jgi:hypothetical protein